MCLTLNIESRCENMKEFLYSDPVVFFMLVLLSFIKEKMFLLV